MKVDSSRKKASKVEDSLASTLHILACCWIYSEKMSDDKIALQRNPSTRRFLKTGVIERRNGAGSGSY